MDKVQFGPQTLLYPKPALLIGANVDDKPNFLTVAWAGIANANPPMLAAAIRHSRYTLKGIRQNMTFSANIPSADMVKETDYCGIVSGAKVDKVKACGFRVSYGKLATAPLIEQCPVNLECKVVHILDLGSHALVIGKITETYVAKKCLTEGFPDVKKVNPLTYMTGQPGEYFGLGTFIGRAFEIGKAIK